MLAYGAPDLADRSRCAPRGYPGVIAHEYDPTPGRDPVRSLEKVFAIKDV